MTMDGKKTCKFTETHDVLIMKTRWFFLNFMTGLVAGRWAIPSGWITAKRCGRWQGVSGGRGLDRGDFCSTEGLQNQVVCLFCLIWVLYIFLCTSFYINYPTSQLIGKWSRKWHKSTIVPSLATWLVSDMGPTITDHMSEIGTCGPMISSAPVPDISWPTLWQTFTKNHGTSPCSMGKSTISMIFYGHIHKQMMLVYQLLYFD